MLSGGIMKLLLIDGQMTLATVYRSLSSDGSAPAGEEPFNSCAASVLRMIRDLKPTHAAVCFDDPSRCARAVALSGYRSERFVLPVHMSIGIRKFIEDLRGRGVAVVVARGGGEAVDLIATMARKVIERNAGAVVVAASDKRFYGMLGAGLSLYSPYGASKGSIKDSVWLQQRYGVEPKRFNDFLLMAGDQGKGIPGIPGIGPKRAKDLLDEYGDLESIAANRGLIEGSSGQSIRDHIDSTIGAVQEAVALNTSIHLGVSLSAMSISKALTEPRGLADRQAQGFSF